MNNTITIFRAIVGSQAYGLSTPSSDTDYKGIYCQPWRDLVSFGYKEQIEINKDETLYEARRFLQLAQSANPTVLELLFSPQDYVLTTSEAYNILYENRFKFLTKKCAHSFGGYAVAQIKKARGLDKKMNWESKRVVRKTPLDFCYVHKDGKTIPIDKYLKSQNMKQEYCGLVNLDHFKDCYALYYDFRAQYGPDANRPHEANGYRGIIKEGGNFVRLSSVPRGLIPGAIMYYNKDGYAMHCRDYAQYKEWLSERNTSRYVDIKGHGQQIDGKNMMHCRRLLDTAIEIATEGNLTIRRPNRDELLAIRKGDVPLSDIISKAEEDIRLMDQLYKSSKLPNEVDPEFVNDLLLAVREAVINPQVPPTAIA